MEGLNCNGWTGERNWNRPPSPPERPLYWGMMIVTITGGRGLIGTALTRALRERGDQVRILSRSPAPGEFRWNPATGDLDLQALEGSSAVIHLAGEAIASGRWSDARKARIRSSRRDGTALVASALGMLTRPPSVLLSASAIGIYGDRGDATLTESSPLGTGFLPTVGAEWEAATAPAAMVGIRTVLLRIGLVLTPEGGILHRLLPPFRLGLGGPIGNGQQWMSWIALPDLVSAALCLLDGTLAGAVNLTAPTPVRNAEFTRTLSQALHRPAVIRVPAFALRLAFGSLADAALLASQRVEPARLIAAGFSFQHPRLDHALPALLAGNAR